MNFRTLKKALLAIAMLLLVFAIAGCKKVESPSAAPDEVVELVTPEAETPEPTIEVEVVEETIEPTPSPLPLPKQGYVGSIGYLNIPNTKVNYTVVVADDNDYYLNKDIDGSRNYRGAIFMDYRNMDPAERRNIILYGHNNKDQTRFSTLHRYNKESFFEQNKDVFFELYGVSYKYEIIFTGVFDYREFNHIKTVFANEQSFIDYYQDGSDHAQYIREGYSPSPGDQILTLSTCVSHGVKDYNYKRMIVVAKMVEVLGVSDKSDMIESFGAVEAQEYFEKLPETQMLSMKTDVGTTTEKIEEPMLLPPGELE